MLRPSKHHHPDRTVVNVSLILLIHLKRHRSKGYDDLRKFAQQSVTGGSALFLEAINFLYLMGAIEYRPKTDAFEYVGPNETF